MRDYQRLGTGPGGYTFGTLFDKIDGLATTDLLCQYIGGSHGQSNLRLKYLAWNFAHIAQGNINTIEFRRFVHPSFLILFHLCRKPLSFSMKRLGF